MVKISIQASSRYPIERQEIKREVKKILYRFGLREEVEVGINFVGERKMRALNKKYRKVDQPTDVLSFPINEKAPNQVLYLGDVIISYPQARKQAAENNWTVDEEIEKLVEHGVMSLLGKHENYS